VNVKKYQFILEAMKKSMAYIEFDLNGFVLDANDNFLKALQYFDLSEIKGKHHKIFCEKSYSESFEYKKFWNDFKNGDFKAGEFQRIKKNGEVVWLQASYNPVLDESNQVVGVVKFAVDITEQKFNSMALFNAMDASQAYIEFTPDGKIVSANRNFTSALGYSSIDEIMGKHHQIFCEPSYARSQEYLDFWKNLGDGKFQIGQFLRKRKDGSDLWIQASYNPVKNITGHVVKVVKYASDITNEKKDWLHLVKTLEETSAKLAAASEELTATATQLTSNSDKTSQQASSAATGAEELSIGMKSVSGSAIELTQSIKEITQSTNNSAKMASESQERATQSSRTMERLGKSSDEIGSFVKIISSIAQQTNLLALNATIEAARAGEAGRGFAVVANEVKELAKQSAKAAEEISSKINNIQNDTRGAIDTIGEIAKSINALSSSSQSISAAVEEQSATMGELSRIVSESNRAVESVSQTVKDVSEGAADSKTAAEQTLLASRDLAKLSKNLSDLVKKLS